MPDENYFGSVKDNLNAKLARDLKTAFDGIAKIAIRASAEFADLENDPGMLQKIQKAHSTVTLIIDDAMRGLNEATMAALGIAVMATMESEEESGDSSSSQS